MSNTGKIGLATTLLGVALFVLAASPLFAQGMGGMGNGGTTATMTHEQMHQMMDAVHGEGTSQRMHDAMGEDAERLMEQCVAMMNTMQMMRGMRDGPAKGDEGQPDDGMREMMNRMMGR